MLRCIAEQTYVLYGSFYGRETYIHYGSSYGRETYIHYGSLCGRENIHYGLFHMLTIVGRLLGMSISAGGLGLPSWEGLRCGDW